MFELLKGNYIKGMDYAISTLSSAFALALGVIFISTIFRSFKLNKLLCRKEVIHTHDDTFYIQLEDTI